MFGYVKVLPAELKVKEYDFYKSVYCGLCNSMGKRTGIGSRMALSYDFVFLALVRISVNKDKMSFCKKRCALKRCASPMLDCCESLDYCAAASSLLSYYKLCDDIEDTKGFKKLMKRLLLPFAEKMRKKAGLPLLDLKIKEAMDELKRLENSEDFGLDNAADVFGNMLSIIASYGIEDKKTADSLNRLGLHIGRWIYIVDAIDDYKEDYKKKRKNPLIRYNSSEELTKENIERLRISAVMEIASAEKAMSEIGFSDYGIEDIVYNILHYGMPDVQEKVLAGEHISDIDNSKARKEKVKNSDRSV